MLFCFGFFCFVLCLTVSVAVSISIFFIDFTGLMRSSISAFEINYLNIFQGLNTPRPLSFLSNLSNTDHIALVNCLSKTLLTKRRARCISLGFLLQKLFIILPNVLPRNLQDWIYFRRLNFTKFYIGHHIVRKSIA